MQRARAAQLPPFLYMSDPLYLILGVVIIAKEIALLYYHRMMPFILRVGTVVPGIGLGMIWLLFYFFEIYIPIDIRVQVGGYGLLTFFIWNGIFLFVTRGQHRRDIL